MFNFLKVLKKNQERSEESRDWIEIKKMDFNVINYFHIVLRVNFKYSII